MFVFFNQLKNIWCSTISLRLKIRIFNTIVKPVLLYGAETWRTTVTITRRIQAFINFCLQSILRICYPDVNSNQEKWERTSQQPIEPEILQRRSRWLGPHPPTTNPKHHKGSTRLEPTGQKEMGPSKKYLATGHRLLVLEAYGTNFV